MHKFDGVVAFRCKPEVRAELKKVSKSLSLGEPEVARAAFITGLKVISDRGIRPSREEARAE